MCGLRCGRDKATRKWAWWFCCYTAGEFNRMLNTVFLCQCGCGEQAPISAYTDRRKGAIKGSPRRYILGHNGFKHRLCRTPEWIALNHVIQRCGNPNCKEWVNYGGRGIKVCAEWRNSYAAFLNYVGLRPSPKHSIERIDNNGHYEPGNVRWATSLEQGQNKRTNRKITCDGTTLTLKEWGRRLGFSYQALQYRLRKGIPINSPKVGHWK